MRLWAVQASMVFTLLVISSSLRAETAPPPKAADETVEGALKWLAKNQEPDGHWSTTKYGADSKTDTACTGFALLAFVRAGNSEKSGAYQNNVQRAVKWLESKQQPNGLIWDNTDTAGLQAIGYPHGIAGWAIIEAANASKAPTTARAAQKAIDYSLKVHQSPKGGFRYQAGSAGCISVSGWYVQQMKAAKTGGLTVDKKSWDRAIIFFKSLEYNENGTQLYTYQPGAETNRRRNMIGAVAQFFLGAQKKEEVRPTIEWAINNGGFPDWGANGEEVDLYYWYYGTLATSLLGDNLAQKWAQALRTALSAHQEKGAEEGSWRPSGDFSNTWGRVGQTALSCLCLLNADAQIQAKQ